MTREEIEKKAEEIAESFRTARSFSRHPSDIAYSAAIQMAEWVDQYPRKGLWDSEKVCERLHEIINSDTIVQYLIFDDENIDFDSELFLEDLREAMED